MYLKKSLLLFKNKIKMFQSWQQTMNSYTAG